MPALRSLVLVAVIALLALPSPAWAAEVTITADGPEPQSVQAEVGETIVWMNDSDAEVTLTSEDPAWTSGPLDPGESFSLSYESEGSFPYSSTDGALEGEVVVAGAPADSDGDGDGGGLAGGGTDAEPTLPATGANALVLLGIVALLILVGAVLLRTSRRQDRR